MAQATLRANAKKSSIRARVEHVFAHQKNRFGLFVRTIGLERVTDKWVPVGLTPAGWFCLTPAGWLSDK